MSMRPDFSDDLPILTALDMADALLIGFGGEARVYAADQQRVLRLLHPGATLAGALARADFLGEIARGAKHLPFATPEVERVLEIDGRIAIFERRLPGVPLSESLARTSGQERQTALESYFNAALSIRDIALSRDYWGDLLGEAAIRTDTYRDYLRERVIQTRNRAGALAFLLDPSIAEAMPDCGAAGFVHFDLFPGNVLMNNGTVSAVIDFGATAMLADPRLELWSAAAYLDPEISPNATEADRAFAQNWLARHGLDADYPKARRWIAAYWSFAQDDPKVMAWCRSVFA